MAEHPDGFKRVITSTYRLTVLDRLGNDGDSIPSWIADVEEMEISHVSRALQTLRDLGFVELKVPEDTKKGRVYGITDDGREVLDAAERMTA